MVDEGLIDAAVAVLHGEDTARRTGIRTGFSTVYEVAHAVVSRASSSGPTMSEPFAQARSSESTVAWLRPQPSGS